MFLSVTAIGEAAGQQVVNIWWYRDPTGSVAFNEDQMSTYLTTWETVVRAPLLAWHNSGYRLKREVAQCYAPTWQRQPYLPLIRDVDLPGAVVAEWMGTITAVILAARVEPHVPAPRKAGTPKAPFSPVTRGYWAFGPVGRADLLNDGSIIPAVKTGTRYAGLRTACLANLAPASGAPTVNPIVVSHPLENQVLRGYGLVKDAAWRDDSSTRRSRKKGRGA